MLHCRDGIGLVMSGAWFPPNMTPGILAKEFNLCLIRQDNFVSHGLRVLQVHFGKLQAGHLPFYKGVASVWPLYHTGLIVELLQRWLSFKKIWEKVKRCEYFPDALYMSQ